MSLDKATAESTVKEFLAEFKGLEQIKIRVLHDRADFVQAYGSAADEAIEAWQGMKAAFMPNRREIHVATESHYSTGDLKTSLAHEGIGHAGINTCTREEKRALLDAVIGSKDTDSTLGRAYWPEIQERYPDASIDLQAEEVYCLAVERSWRRRDLNKTAYEHAWQNSVMGDKEPLQAWGLAQVGQHIAQGLRENTRQIQIIPAADDELFRAGDGQDVAQSRKAMEGVTTTLQAKPLPGGLNAVVKDADPHAGKPYTGKVIEVTQHHALQQIGANKFVVHELGKAGPLQLEKGKSATIGYPGMQAQSVAFSRPSGKELAKGPER